MDGPDQGQERWEWRWGKVGEGLQEVAVTKEVGRRSRVRVFRFVLPGNTKNYVGSAGSTLFVAFLEMRRTTCRKKLRNGAQKKVPESEGLVGACPSLTSDRSAARMLEAATANDFD